jgi:hypothetical protein
MARGREHSDRCVHGLRLCSKCIVISDAAKRMCDTINAMICFRPWDQLVRVCMAFRLDDGTTDGTFYPNRATALRYQLRPCCVFYFRNCLGGARPLDCQIFLNVNRVAYETDRIAWTDPESPDIIVSTRGFDHMTGRG